MSVVMVFIPSLKMAVIMKSRWGVCIEITRNPILSRWHLRGRRVFAMLPLRVMRRVLVKQWFDLATASGIYKDETDTEEVVVIGDGAAWIWNLSDEYFPGAVEIVDYMYAKSHLYKVAKQAFGEKAYESIQSWVEATEPFLYARDTETVVLRIRALGVGTPTLCEVLQREAGYFQKPSKRMQYQTFAEKGYHIGSGLIESACKHVVAQRCKQASMKWSQTGINAVLFWRCLLKSNAWDTFWDQQVQNTA